MTLNEPPDGGDISQTNSNATRAAVAAAVLPHLDAAFNLARWLTRDEHDAADVVQQAYLRAMTAADTFRGGGGAKSWLLTIVRNTAFDRLRRDKTRRQEELGDDLPMTPSDAEACDPQAILLRAANAERVRAAIEELPDGIREVIVLREMEELSYKEVAAVVGVPIGTIMSRLARGRQRLQQLLSEPGEST
ncbi:MAG TPA: sigma-70 family RNA polymerase sigma factor, partial [Tepidisphaeraceae bacterium]|nr:sigma-70 family RNA polymerase sigma factor [Tepidisphaeraceae bacterium]